MPDTKNTIGRKKSLLSKVSDEHIKDLLLKGHTTTEVAYILGCDIYKLYRRLKYIQDLPDNTSIGYKKKRTQQELQELFNQITQLITKGYLYKEVARKLNITISDINDILKRNKVDTRKLITEGRKNRKFLEDVGPIKKSPKRSSKEIDLLCEQIVELLKKGYSHKEIKKQLGISPNANIAAWLKSRNINSHEIAKQNRKSKSKEFIDKVNEIKKDSTTLVELAVKLGVGYSLLKSTNLKKIEQSINK